MNATTIFDIDALSEYQKAAMCRTIASSINRLLEDEKNRADYERWKKEKQLYKNQ